MTQITRQRRFAFAGSNGTGCIGATAVRRCPPSPLPPGVPDAQNSWRRQMATSANALWETFLQGRDMSVAQDEWRRAAEELGAHVGPIIDFLREHEKGKG